MNSALNAAVRVPNWGLLQLAVGGLLMRRSFKEIAASIIHWRHRHVRRKVTVALEDAYQNGLDDAAAHLEATARDIRG